MFTIAAIFFAVPASYRPFSMPNASRGFGDKRKMLHAHLLARWLGARIREIRRRSRQCSRLGGMPGVERGPPAALRPLENARPRATITAGRASPRAELPATRTCSPTELAALTLC